MSQVLTVYPFEIGFSPMARAAIQADNGDYVLAGRLFDENSRSSGFALRLRPDGSPVWEKTYSDKYDVFFASLTQIADGTFVAVGTFFRSQFSGDEDIWVVNLDAAGNVLWQKTFGQLDRQSDGQGVAATADGGFVVAGTSLVKGGNMAFTRVLKFDRERNLQWDRYYDGGLAFAVAATRDGGYILAGARNIPASLNSNVYALRLDEAGARIWERSYPDLEVYVLLASGVAEAENGDFVIAAKSVVMRVDCRGDVVWARQVGNFNLNSIAALPNDNLAVAGSLIANFFDHAYVAVLNGQGTKILWDNTELLYNSAIAQVLVNREGYVTGGGYAPFCDGRNQVFLAIFDNVGEIG